MADCGRSGPILALLGAIVASIEQQRNGTMSTRGDHGRRGPVSRRARVVALIMPLALMTACVGTNPNYDAPGSQRTDSSGAAAETSGMGPGGTGDAATESGSGMADAGGDAGPDSADASMSAGDSTGAATSTSDGAMAETGAAGTDAVPALDPFDLGQACGQNDDCQDLGVGAECCDAKQCEGTCMVACEQTSDCPFPDMGCEHGYCLFPCGNGDGGGDDSDDGGDDGDGDDDGDDGDDDGANADADCSDWPGYTCQHGMRFCEND